MEKFINGYDELKKINFHDAKILQFDSIKPFTDYIDFFIILSCGSIYLLRFIEVDSMGLSIKYREKKQVF